MQHHTDDERALIETFRAAGGVRVVFFRRGQPRLPKAEAEALARLVRSGHIRRHATGDFGWVSYRLREQVPTARPTVSEGQPAEAEPSAAPEPAG